MALAEALSPEVVAVHTQRDTGAKMLVDPRKGIAAQVAARQGSAARGYSLMRQRLWPGSSLPLSSHLDSHCGPFSASGVARA